MDLGAVRALALDLNFDVHGVDVALTCDDITRAVRGIWISDPNAAQPTGAVLQRMESVFVMAFRRSEVSELPRGSTLTAPRLAGAESEPWIVDARAHADAEEIRVVLRRAPEA